VEGCPIFPTIRQSRLTERPIRARILWEIISLPMQAFLASLTAALLFIHAIFGCCWHHTHRCGHDSTAPFCQPATGCQHHQHDNDGTQQEKPCGCKVECEGTCIYVLPQKVKVEAPQAISFDFLAVLPSLANHPIGTAASWEAGWSPPDFVPPLRTHLLHQVLLN
jgi:hypothetical protein